jgi:DNA-binding MarR family transcriptional regulator
MQASGESQPGGAAGGAAAGGAAAGGGAAGATGGAAAGGAASRTAASPPPARRAADERLVEDLAGFVKYLLHAHGGDFFKAVGELDLSFSQVRILSLLVRELQSASLKDLADRLGLSLPAVSRSVEGLVQRGYVTRAEDADDRRVKNVAATGDGRALFARLAELRVAGAADFVETLSARERARLAAALAPIVAREDVAALIDELMPGSR